MSEMVNREGTIRRQLRCVAMLIRMKIARQMVFRLSFFGAFFVDGSLFAIQILLFSAIYSQVDGIGGWSRGEMLFFMGTFSLLNALSMTLTFFGIVTIPHKIASGELDHYLTKPMNPLLRLCFENVDLGSAPLVLGSVGILVYGAKEMGVVVTAGQAGGYALLVLAMLVLYCDVELVLRVPPFFVISGQNFSKLEELLVLNMRLPGTLFKGVWKALFYLVLPYGVMATVPTQFFAGTLSWPGLLYAVALVAGFTAFTLWFWRFGLRRYKSASS